MDANQVWRKDLAKGEGEGGGVLVIKSRVDI